jgi:gamma-glutamyltranspeptidase/glutathione hydrolase
LERDEGARATFLLPDSSGPHRHAPRAGEWFRNPDYARTLRAIASGGPGVFYGGPLGAKLVARVHELGGFLTIDDLRKNEPTWVTPISVDFKGYRVWELPPNNQGVAALEMLKMLEPYDLPTLGTTVRVFASSHRGKSWRTRTSRDTSATLITTVPPSYLLSDKFITERRSHRSLARGDHVDPGPALTSAGGFISPSPTARTIGLVHQQSLRRIGRGVVRGWASPQAAAPGSRWSQDCPARWRRASDRSTRSFRVS